MRLKEPKRTTEMLGDIVRDGFVPDNPEMEVECVHYEPVHIAKCSWGWVPSFQATPSDMPFDEQEEANGIYEISSLADIRRYLDTGDYELVDEYGDVRTRDEFENVVVDWCEHQRAHGFKGEFNNHTDKYDGLFAYKDAEGYQFCRVCFC